MLKIKITVHGAAQEVGRSCIEIDGKNSKILLDAGLKLTEEGTKFPRGLYDLSEIDAVFLTHGHLDHCGALPLFDYNGLKAPIFCTRTTAKIAEMMLKDAYKIGRYHHENLGYFVENIQKAVQSIRRINLREKGEIKKVNFQFYNAGHIPGSSVIKLTIDNKNILYTGDFNTNETHLHNAADTDYGEVDILIIESTYGDRDHPERKKEEKQFLSEIKKAVQKGGSVIIPSFAVGRAQELLLMLAKEDFDCPVYIDGMAIEATELVLSIANDIKDPNMLRKAYRKARPVEGSKQRESIVRKQGIYVTTSGMMTGGPVAQYVEKFYRDPKSAILLTGYQAKGTNGRMLLEENCVYINGYKTKVKCTVKQYDFSAHPGMSDLQNFIIKTSPKKIIFIHGDIASIESMRKWAKSKKFDAIAPKSEEQITI